VPHYALDYDRLLLFALVIRLALSTNILLAWKFYASLIFAGKDRSLPIERCPIMCPTIDFGRLLLFALLIRIVSQQTNTNTLAYFVTSTATNKKVL
jgi:hypothetical protein